MYALRGQSVLTCVHTHGPTKVIYTSLEKELDCSTTKAPCCVCSIIFLWPHKPQLMGKNVEMGHRVSKFLIHFMAPQLLSRVGVIFLSVPGNRHMKKIHVQDMSQGWALSPSHCHSLISEEWMGYWVSIRSFPALCEVAWDLSQTDRWMSWAPSYDTHTLLTHPCLLPPWGYLPCTIDQPPCTSPIQDSRYGRWPCTAHLLVTSTEGKAWAHCFPSVFWVSLKTDLCLVRCSQAEV